MFHWAGFLLVMLFVFGAALQIIRKQDDANALLAAGTSSFIGVQHALEGKGTA